MATVLDCYEVVDGLSGGATADAGGDYTRVFMVEFDAIHSDPAEAILASGVPLFGDVHPSDSSVYVVDLKAEPASVDDPYDWRVTVRYGIPKTNPTPDASPPSPSSAGSPGSPIRSQRRQFTWWTKSKAEHYGSRTSYGTGAVQPAAPGSIVNTASVPFDPPFARDFRYRKYIFTRTQSSIDDDWMNQVDDAVNLDAFTIGTIEYPAGTLLCNVEADWPAGQQGSGYQVTIEIKHDPDGWAFQPLDAGYFYYEGGIGASPQVKKWFMVEGLGVKDSIPRYLNGVDGDKSTDGPHYLNFPYHPCVDFTLLQLDY